MSFSIFVTWNTALNCYLIPFILCVQVSKTDPSPKREMPTMILFNVVFALRVRKVVFVVVLFLFIHSYSYYSILLQREWCGWGVLVSDNTLYLRIHKKGRSKWFCLIMLPVMASPSLPVLSHRTARPMLSHALNSIIVHRNHDRLCKLS